MGVYTDFFIASPEEAKSIVESDDLFSNWPNLSIKSIFNIELGELWALIDDIDPMEGALKLLGDLLYQSPEGEPIVCTVNSEFVDALAGISVDDAGKYATLWAKKECFDGWPIEIDTAAEIIVDLSNFARHAKNLNKPVLFVG